MAKKASHRGPEAFDRYFSAIYGPRWPSLKKALLDPPRPEAHIPGLTKPYYLDGASVTAASALGVRPGDDVLDLCAAPGGKSLVLAVTLAGQGQLTCNDRSSDRRSRLRRVLDDHLPPAFRTPIRITGHDATRWGLHEREAYDRILLDAPCSSERHVLRDPSALVLWSEARTRTLAQQALAMLCSALEALRPGGWMLYSTCSISPDENEKLLDRFQAKRPGAWSLVEQTLILPDQSDGEGPLFWALLRKAELNGNSVS